MELQKKLASIVLIVISAATLVIAGIYFFGGSSDVTIQSMEYIKMHNTDPFLIWTVILFAITTLLTLGFSVVNIFSSRKALVGFGIALLAAGVLVLISYLLSDTSGSFDFMKEDEQPTLQTIRWAGAGIILTVILAVVAFVGIIVSEIVRAVQ
jgi:hypothetical protein